MKKDPNIVATAIRWLTEDWGVATVAELVLKLVRGSENSVMFADLVQAVSVDWPRSKQLDLFNILLIGESAATTAQQPEYAARQWMLHEKIDFLQSCSNTLRWGPVFAREFLMNYSGLVMKEDVVKMKKLQEDIMDTFECVTADSTTLCLALFMDVEEVDLVNGFEELCMASPVLERCDSGLAGLEVDEKLK
ncbi:hypothetical protein BC829DRAFT_379873 [Chytridium lagenaria]|nr:hypothetical protein BC829DRAFT_379873 [Chytridium lagenaria]